MAETADCRVTLSQSLVRAAEDAARREGAAVDRLVATALAQKLDALAVEDVIARRAARVDWGNVRAVLDRVGTEPPRDGDELPG